jgi:hypothetical protein
MPYLPTVRRALRKLRGSLHVDLGPADATTLVCGMGRSGTTWVANLINHDRTYRTLFEPFHNRKVPAARGFEYIQYLGRADHRPELETAAERILEGRVRNLWIDQENSGFLFRRRLIKEVRCNLMVGWLRELRPRMPLVLVVRSPWSVVSSWLTLGWGTESMGDRTDFDRIIAQTALLRDFPIVAEVLKEVNRDDPLERIIFQWCVFLLVPLGQLDANERLVVAYENLLLHPDREVERLLRYLGAPQDGGGVRRAVHTPSSTNFRNRNVARDQGMMLSGWKSDLTAGQIERGHWLLSLFGMEGLYSADGIPNPQQHPGVDGMTRSDSRGE